MVDTMNHIVGRVSPLGHLPEFRHGEAAVSGPSLSLSARTDLGIVQVFARSGKAEFLATEHGFSPQPGQASAISGMTTLPLSPGQWLVVSDQGSEGQLRQQLASQLGEVAYISEQSHSRVAFRVSGDKARQVMQKGCRLDLHPSQAQSGFCAQTSMAQVGVLIHQVDDAPSYDLYVYSGFAMSFWHWLHHSALEFLDHS